MINSDQSIPCPDCGTKILFDTKQLLMGVQFACPTCFAKIGLAPESRPIVQETIEKLEDLKAKISNK